MVGGLIGKVEVGIAPAATLYSGMVIPGLGDTRVDEPTRVLAGFEWALENGAHVLNASLGIAGDDPFYLEVVRRLVEDDCVVVAAIGNDGYGSSYSPANYRECVAVGAIDSSGRVPKFSSSRRARRGVKPTQPDVVAPGVDIASAGPGRGVHVLTGTSHAAPHVAGAIALIRQAKPKASAAEVIKALYRHSTKGKYITAARGGRGTIDVQAAIDRLP